MKKEHETYQLIQAMESSEKAYFKKFSLKKRAKNSSYFLILFELLDKQKNYCLDKLIANKKLPEEFTKNIYPNLYTLKKVVLSKLIEYNKSKNELSEIFDMFLEYDILKNKKLTTAADKKIISIEKHINKNNLFYFKPFLYYRMNESLLNNTTIKKEYKISQYKKYEESIEDLFHRGKLNITASKFEILIERNGSLNFKEPALKIELSLLRDGLNELLIYFKKDFVAYITTHNNLLIMNMMLGKTIDVKNASIAFIKYFKSVSKTISNDAKAKSFLNFKNIAYYNLLLKNNDVYDEIMTLFKNEIKLFEDEVLIRELSYYRVNLKASFYFLNPEEKPTQADIQSFLNNLKEIEKSNTLYFELLTTTSIILANENRFQESLDLTSKIFVSEFSERVIDSYIFLKCGRAICWLKLEKLDLFNSEFNSIYKFLLKYQNFSFAKELMNFIKKNASEKTINKKKKALKALLNEFETIQVKGSLLEKMEATELKILLELALKK